MARSTAVMPYICPRCAALPASQLSATRRSLLRAASRRATHTVAPTPNDEQSKTRPLIRRSHGRDTPRWAAPLKSTSLGSSTSILVLNDSSRSRGRRGEAMALEEVVPNKHNTMRILEIIEKQAKVPGQDEVNKSIDALRPDDTTTYADRLVVPRERFDAAAASLVQQFNLGQLSRYVAVEQGKLLANSQDQTVRIGQSQWLIKSRSGEVARYTSRSAKLTGKKAVVDALLRSVWQLDIEDEAMADGSLEMYPTTSMLQLLALQKRAGPSKLSSISRRCQVRVEVRAGVVEIHGSKPACMRAAHDMNLAVDFAAETSFGLEPFSDASSINLLDNMEKLGEAASRYNAVLQKEQNGQQVGLLNIVTIFWSADSSPNKIIITAETSPMAQRCKKMLLQRLLEARVPAPTLARSLDAHGAAANLIEAVPQSSGLDGTWYSATSVNLARGETPILLRPKFPTLSDENISSAVHYLRNDYHLRSGPAQETPQHSLADAMKESSTWAASSQMVYGVEMGTVSFGGRGKLGQPLHPRFEELVPGLSQFFLAELRNSVPTSKTYLQTDWVASPWDNPTVPLSELVQLPRLRLALLPNASTRGFDMDSLVAVEAVPRQILLQLPNTSSDLRVTQREQLEIHHPLQDVRLAELFDSFNKEAQYNGLEKAEWHDTLKVRLPGFLLPRDGSKQSAGQAARDDGKGESREIVFTALPSILTQKASVPFEGFNLEYQSQYGGESASPYSLSLQMSLESSVAASEVEDAQRKLLAAADKLSCQLSGAIGPFKIPPALAKEFEGQPRSVLSPF